MDHATNGDLLTDEEIDYRLRERLGPLHVRQRLGIEHDHEAQIFGQGLNFFHIENFPFSHGLITSVLKLTGLYWIGRRNATRVRVTTNDVFSAQLPASFDQFTILQLSDLHLDMSPLAMKRMAHLVKNLNFDVCVLTGDYRAHVLTGDYRAQTYGAIQPCLRGLIEVIASVKKDPGKPAYGVLGNHDTIRMVPDIERMGVAMLLNECIALERDGHQIHIAGIDDAHFYPT